MRITPTSELEYRNLKLRQFMGEEKLDAVIILQNADLFYFTGTIQSGALYIPLEGEPIYMVRKDYRRARMESGLKRIVPFSSMKDVTGILSDYGCPMPKRIGMELDVLPVNFFERYRKVFPDAVVADATPIIRRVRMIKTNYEIRILEDAASQVDRIFRRAREIIREGMTEIELAAELEYTARLAGHQGFLRMRAFNAELFYAHVFSGEDSAVSAYMDTPLGGVGPSPAFGQGAGYGKIRRNEPIIIDFAGCLDGYMVDQTRMFAIGGMPDLLKKGYNDMLKIQERMMELAEERRSWGDIYDECISMAAAQGYSDHFMGYKGAQVSFIGHGIGVEIDEFPFIAKGFNDMPLEKGMVFAFEPKLVYPGVGSVGIENTFHLGEQGLNMLTYSEQDIVIL
jgi:Xaa-Pro dipeptidase